jgi:hypothetical protein
VVADALSRNDRIKSTRVRAATLSIQTSLSSQIIASQTKAFEAESLQGESLRNMEKQFEKKHNGMLYFMDRVWIPDTGNLRKLIIEEAHESKYSINPGANKMYKDLREYYW